MQKISKENMEAMFVAACFTATGATIHPRQMPELHGDQLLTLVTVAQFVTDLCINELERRDMLQVCEGCGGPKVPYISDYSVPTIFTREDGEDQPSGQPTAH